MIVVTGANGKLGSRTLGELSRFIHPIGIGVSVREPHQTSEFATQGSRSSWAPIWAVLLIFCLHSLDHKLQAQDVRAEAPIRAVQLSDGTIRFAVPIKVGGRQILAGLDTGSTGLQLLPAAQNNLQPAEGDMRASYGSGVLLTGHAAHAQLQIGAVHGDVVSNQVLQVSCLPTKPDCGASKVPLSEFGILGDGLAREGFSALLGLRTQREIRAGHPENPLQQLGVHRWIIVLPQPNGGEAGRLVLNPTDEDLAGFVTVPSGGATGEVQACLDRPEPAQTHVCASALLDTGAPGISVPGAMVPDQVRGGAQARISFGTEQSPQFAIGVRLNERAQMSRYRVVEGNGEQGPLLHLGPLPYLSFAVLYDARNNSIAMRPRQTYSNGPVFLRAR